MAMKTASQQYLAQTAARIEAGLLAAEQVPTSQEWAHLTLRSEENVTTYLDAAAKFRAGQMSANGLVSILGPMLDPSAK